MALAGVDSQAGSDPVRGLAWRHGRELIDGISSWLTECHGYNHPHIRASVAAQLERMPHVMLGMVSTFTVAESGGTVDEATPESTDSYDY